MSNGYGYHKRLSEEQCISKLDGFLSFVGGDCGFLWDGNPSLIEEYGLSNVVGLEVDFRKEIILGDAFPVGNSYEGKFSSLGIVKKQNNFLYCLEDYDENISLIANTRVVYDKLKNQFDIQTEAVFNGFSKSIENGITWILESELEQKMKDLSSKLKKIV
jgi:hypothetical protein